MVMEFIGDSILLWLSLFTAPFLNFILLWRMIPIYLNGFLAAIYSTPSAPSALFSGIVAWWAGADWIRAYMQGELIPSQLNWVIAVSFCVYGVLALLVGLLKKERLYQIFGRRTLLTFFLISFYPIQTGYMPLNTELVIAIFIALIPFMLIFGTIAFFVGKYILKANAPSQTNVPIQRFPKRRFFKRNIRKS